MGLPENCLCCNSRFKCNSAMYSKGCHYFPPVDKNKEEKSNPLKKFFGKFFK